MKKILFLQQKGMKHKIADPIANTNSIIGEKHAHFFVQMKYTVNIFKQAREA